MPSSQYIGLMCGTSLDAIDVALIETTPEITLLAAQDYPFPPALRSDLLALCQPGNDEIERMGRADRQLGQTLAKAVIQFLNEQSIETSAIAAIGSHGQTIRHRPGNAKQALDDAFTLQIGDPNTLAEMTGINVVADFRRRDISAGGQGAPLVPAFHKAAFGDALRDRVVANIGGMANISVLRKGGDVSGFDTGPGNVLLDSWIQHCKNRHYDRDGEWASTGRVNNALLKGLLDNPYYQLAGPKSTGREDYNLAMIQAQLSALEEIPQEDVQATLLELTAVTLVDAISKEHLSEPELYLCGGGAHNTALRQRIAELMPGSRVEDTSTLDIHPNWVEAAAFAWLAHATLNGIHGNVPCVTGARGARLLGAIYPA